MKKKDVGWHWGEAEQRSFEALKEAFGSAPVLMMPDIEGAFVVETDASDFATGAVLSQHGADGELHPVAYYSKSLSATERNYDVAPVSEYSTPTLTGSVCATIFNPQLFGTSVGPL